MESLNRLIFAIFGRDAHDYLGGTFMFIVYGALFLILLITMILGEKILFSHLKIKPWVRFTATMIGVFVFYYFIPWIIWTVFIK